MKKQSPRNTILAVPWNFGLVALLFLISYTSLAQFNVAWTRASNPTSNSENPFCIAADASGIYVGGKQYVAASNDQWRIEKRDLVGTGALITAFDGDGIVTTDPSAGIDVVRGLALYGGYLYLAGYSNVVANDDQWRIEKRNATTGALDVAFDGDGILTSDPSASFDYAYCIAADASGIYIAGTDRTVSSTDAQWRIEKRDLSSGALIAAFGAGGIVQSNQTVGDNDEILAIAIDATGIYLGGYYTVSSSSGWYIEKRNLTTGALIWSAPEDITPFPNTNLEYVYDLTVDASGVYLAGTDASAASMQWRIEKRELGNGALIAAFGVGGIVQSNPSPNVDQADAIAINGSGIFIGGREGFVSTADPRWRIEMRNLTDGSLICTHTNDFTVRLDMVYAMTAVSSGLYAVGVDGGPAAGNSQWRIEKYDIACGISLPVELISFYCRCTEQNSILLQWATASEINNDFFTLEHASDGINFKQSGIIDAAGSTNQTSEYSFTDSEPNEGISYYRLKQTDYDGNYEYFGLISVNCSSEEGITIFPNPFSTQTILHTDSPLHNATLTVDNCFGQTVAQIKNISGQTITFNRDNLPSGLYFVRLTEENKTIAVDKLVITDK